MRICALLTFKGNAKEAMTFYSGVFRAKPDYMTYAEMPPDPALPVSEAMKPLILHAELFIAGGQSLTFMDDVEPGAGLTGNVFSLALMLEDEAEQRRIFAELAEGGTVIAPLAETFWSALFGTLVDRFGVTWHLNLCRQPAGQAAG